MEDKCKIPVIDMEYVETLLLKQQDMEGGMRHSERNVQNIRMVGR